MQERRSFEARRFSFGCECGASDSRSATVHRRFALARLTRPTSLFECRFPRHGMSKHSLTPERSLATLLQGRQRLLGLPPMAGIEARVDAADLYILNAHARIKNLTACLAAARKREAW